tara:strand:+ start:575 stop:817 length:243 start_codon:yes stop_codon:yes gene_type:complete
MKYLCFALLAVSGCVAPTYERGTFDYVGCHTVTENPATDGERAFFAFIDLRAGNELFFKQIDNDTGKATTVSTGVKCDDK